MKVPLIDERRGEFFRRNTRPLKELLPFYERDGVGYVHRARSATMHYRDDGVHTHTSVSFWCGAAGFLYPAGKQPKKHAPARMLNEPSPGRLVCATCQARAYGSGQVGNGRLGDEFVKYRPHTEFFPRGRR